MNLQLREARSEDCPRLLELVRELAAFERAPDEVTVSLEAFREAGFGPRAVWKAFVAVTEEGFIPGFALYYVRFSTWKGCRMYLEDIVVTEAMRNQGIGRMLLERCIREAREQGFDALVWQVLDWNRDAIRFYQRFGARLDGQWLNATLSLPENR